MRAIVALFFLLFVSTAIAESMELEYKRFYSHVRKLQGEDTNALQFAFGFKHIERSSLCQITSAYIHTQKQDIALVVSRQHRFTVPSDKVLKMADAKVRIELQQPLNKCDLSVQLETKPEFLKDQYNQTELHYLLSQYEAFFAQMGSFLSFLMPKVTGLAVHFTDSQLDTRLANGLVVKRGLLNLDKAWIEQGHRLNLPVKPMRITAIAKK